MSDRTSPPVKEFVVDVPGIGAFTFLRRTMRLELAISVEYSRATGGIDTPSPFLTALAGWIAALKVLTVAAPAGWDIDAMDPLDDETYTKLQTVFGALRAREDEFRPQRQPPVAGAGAG